MKWNKKKTRAARARAREREGHREKERPRREKRMKIFRVYIIGSVTMETLSSSLPTLVVFRLWIWNGRSEEKNKSTISTRMLRSACDRRYGERCVVFLFRRSCGARKRKSKISHSVRAQPTQTRTLSMTSRRRRERPRHARCTYS